MNLDKNVIEFMRKSVPELYLLEYYTIRGKPITFNIKDKNQKLARGHRPWQIEILNDKHEDKVCRKSRQLGLSELGVAENIYFVDVHSNVKSLYTFPRNRQLVDFVKTRMNPVLENNEYFKTILDKNVNSLEVKKIKDSFMMFRSAWGGALGEGVDIDFLAFDEYDRMQDNVELAFQESMKSSAYGWLRRWSTPTIPMRGIDAQFQKSDQRHYMHKCDKCNEWQLLSVEENIIQIKPNGVNYITEEIEDGTYEFVCVKCKEVLDRWYNGSWVAKYPERKQIRGYHISQLNAVWISADDIMRRELKYPSKQLFRNYVIGEPFTNEGLVITEEDILSSQRFDAPKTSRTDYVKVVAGIDWGHQNWCTLLGVKEDGQMDLLHTWMFQDNPSRPLEPVSMFHTVLSPFNPDLIIADHGYGADRNTFLAQLFKGRVWACKFNTYKNGSKMMDTWNEASREISVDKTVKVQRLLHTIKARNIGVWRMNEELAILTKHLKNVRIMDEEEDGVVYQVATRVGADHLACALVYALLGVEKLRGIYNQRQDFMFDFF